VRETLFNWLAPIIQGARCLDLFAGSGALGFEAVSRGAAEVVMVERSDAVSRVLDENARSLDADRVRVVRADALGWLCAAGDPFDVIFLDPPFNVDLMRTSCGLLSRNGWLGSEARVYLESPSNRELPPLPAGWELVRDKRAGRVRFALAVVRSAGEAPFQAASAILR
jgi:16S rRNA (guanine966-N2)-methyltransferase